MALSWVISATHFGLGATSVHIEVDVAHSEKPCLVIVGLPDAAVREAKDRVLTAVKNSGFDISTIHATVNLAPADLKKEGSLFDLPIALCLLASMNKISKEALDGYLIVGELGLGGTLRPIKGALAFCNLAKQLKLKGIILPLASAKEAALVENLEIIAADTIKSLISHFQGKTSLIFSRACQRQSEPLNKELPPLVDLAHIHGQAQGKRAVEIAASGNHNILLSGPPGTGKSMLAKALVGILPELDYEEALEVTQIYSLSQTHSKNSTETLSRQRPFRSPHHTVSYAGLIGGGTNPKPGEVALAHRGVLFLDELPEFSRHALETLREPLEERKITISRSQGTHTFPANFIFVAAMNPCPCGFLGHPEKPCKDSALQIDRYTKKISGPLLDRIDLHVTVNAVKASHIEQATDGESSAVVQKRVSACRKRQSERFGSSKTNAEMSVKELQHYFPLQPQVKTLLDTAADSLHLSLRGYFRTIRLAATIADLASEDRISEEAIFEALSYRAQLHHN